MTHQQHSMPKLLMDDVPHPAAASVVAAGAEKISTVQEAADLIAQQVATK
jgi:hypothetical protein